MWKTSRWIRVARRSKFCDPTLPYPTQKKRNPTRPVNLRSSLTRPGPTWVGSRVVQLCRGWWWRALVLDQRMMVWLIRNTEGRRKTSEVLHIEWIGLWSWDETELVDMGRSHSRHCVERQETKVDNEIKESDQGGRSSGWRRMSGNDITHTMWRRKLEELVCGGNNFVFKALLCPEPVHRFENPVRIGSYNSGGSESSQCAEGDSTEKEGQR